MLNRFSVRNRLAILVGVTWIALIGLGLLGYSSVRFVNYELDHVYLGGTEEISHLIEVQQKGQNAIEEWKIYLKSDKYLKDEYLQEWKELTGKVTELLKSNSTSLAAPISRLIAMHIEDSKWDYENGKSSALLYEKIMIIGMATTLLLSFAIAYAIIRSIVQPLNFVVQKVDRLAEGDTSITIQSEEGGELGQLLESLKNMIVSSEKMSKILSQFASGDLSERVVPRSTKDTLGISLNEMSTQMRAMIGDIKEEVNVLTSSSQEILSSLSQLSSGSAESAAAVTETTTTLEELKQTAHVSSEKAKDVLSSAEETLVTVKSSEKSVQSVIEDMNQIQDRMQIISESIVKLSEKSLAIAEIMDSVNDIAEQSNLLAVNAAIEAAKAGEQGRSFSIVAQEIRTLAEQSKGATIQVRALLNDIQNATNAAVLATEQGSKAVAKGVEQSTQTTEAIKELAANMIRVTQSANQIVLSNQQQSIGTEQISIAMSNINESTQQHVDRLKEIEGAISAMNKVSTSLKGLTDQYKTIQIATDGERLSHLIDKVRHEKALK